MILAWEERPLTGNRVRAVVALTVLAAAASSSGVAQPRIDTAPRIETECRLKYLRNTKSEAARSYVSKSCNFMSLPSAGSGLSRDEKVFHDCVLEVMPGTEDDRNAVQLANACRERAWGR